MRCWNIAAAGAISSATCSGSTGVDQSRSVEPFHCDVFAFSYSFPRPARVRS
jgi:hypothetical protein